MTRERKFIMRYLLPRLARIKPGEARRLQDYPLARLSDWEPEASKPVKLGAGRFQVVK